MTIIENDDNVSKANIYIQPPDDGNVSDGDSGDEDYCNLNNLPGSQLLQEVESSIFMNNGEIIELTESSKTGEDLVDIHVSLQIGYISCIYRHLSSTSSPVSFIPV